MQIHDVHLSPGDDAHGSARKLVIAGAENGPVRYWRDGRHVMSHGSLFRAAATAVVEEPNLHTVRWSPHPRAVVDARLMDVVASEHAAMTEARAAKKRK